MDPIYQPTEGQIQDILKNHPDLASYESLLLGLAKGNRISGDLTDDGLVNILDMQAVKNQLFNKWEPPVEPCVYKFMISRKPDRSDSVEFGGQKLSGDIYVFTTPDENVSSVVFKIDNAIIRTENRGPYDLAGTDDNGYANPFDVNSVSESQHEVIAEIKMIDGTLCIVKSTFTAVHEDDGGGVVPPPSGDYPFEVLPPLPDAEIFSGLTSSIGFNQLKDQEKSWIIKDSNINGIGHDSSIYAVGNRCRIENVTTYNGKHGIRIASGRNLVINNCKFSSSDSGSGSGIKLCGIGSQGPSSSNVVVQNCEIVGRVTVKPQNATNASLEHIENIYIVDTIIKPLTNVGVKIAATNVWCENVTVDFRDYFTGRDCVAFEATNYYGCMPQNVTIKNCRILVRPDQTETLIVSDIPINT